MRDDFRSVTMRMMMVAVRVAGRMILLVLMIHVRAQMTRHSSYLTPRRRRRRRMWRSIGGFHGRFSESSCDPNRWCSQRPLGFE